MNLKTNRSFKYLLVAILLIAAAGFALLAARVKGDTVEVETTLLEYQLQPEINLLTRLQPNDIYQNSVIGDDQVVITALLKDMQFNSDFTLSSEQADSVDLKVIQNEYMVAYYGEDKRVLWQRNMVPQSVSETAGNNVKLTTERTFDPIKFKNFLTRVSAELNIDFSVSIYAEWQVSGAIKKGDLVKPIEATYRIDLPLFDKMYTIDKTQIVGQSDAITESQTIRQPAELTAALPFVAAALIALIAALALVMLFKERPALSDYQKQTAQIGKKYGDQLSRIENGIVIQQEIKACTFDDLLKVANELRQPICYYQFIENDLDCTLYCVFDQQRTYTLLLREQVITRGAVMGAAKV